MCVQGNPGAEDYVLDRDFGYKWEETIKLLVGIEGVPIIGEIVSSNCYPSQDRRVFFALECLKEISDIKSKEEAEFAAGLAMEGSFNPYFNDSSCGGAPSYPPACWFVNEILHKCSEFLSQDEPTGESK